MTFAPTTTPLDGSVTVPRSEALVWPQAPALRIRIPVKSVTQERIVRSFTPHPRYRKFRAQDMQAVEWRAPRRKTKGGGRFPRKGATSGCSSPQQPAFFGHS